MIFGVTVTWAYINNQLDTKKRYAIHISDDDYNAVCRRTINLDETTEGDVEWFLDNPWACKICVRNLEKVLTQRK